MRDRKCGRFVQTQKKVGKVKKKLNSKFFILLARKKLHAFFLVT